MAMSPNADTNSDGPDDGDSGMMDAAVQQLRRHTDDRWVEIESDLLARVLATPRTSHPLRALSPAGFFAVSEQVLVAYLHSALDPTSHCEISAIHLHASGDVCTAVTVVVTAQYGHSVLDIADALRGRAEGVIASVLGDVRPRVTITDMHVHVDDISRGDPKRGEP